MAAWSLATASGERSDLAGRLLMQESWEAVRTRMVRSVNREFWKSCCITVAGSGDLVMDRSMGLLVILGGVFIIVIGLLIYAGAFRWFGQLPGDIRYESGNVRVYIPIVSMLLISLALTLIFNLLRRFF